MSKKPGEVPAIRRGAPVAAPDPAPPKKPWGKGRGPQLFGELVAEEFAKDQSLRDTLAANIRGARAEAGLTQDEVAHRAGCARKLVSNIEAGTANATLDTLLALAKALNRTPAELLTPRAPR